MSTTPEEFAFVGRYNAFRPLVRCGWIQDDGSFRPYTNDEPYTGPRFCRYVLTDSGRAALEAWQRRANTEVR